VGDLADGPARRGLIERLHGLPTLASRNRAFNRATPTGPNFEANGAPAPPRDGMSQISDLTELTAAAAAARASANRSARRLRRRLRMGAGRRRPGAPPDYEAVL
jgi:hypothetical protein